MSFIGATGYNENQEELDTLQDEIDANASYINNLVGIPDPLHTAIFGINLLNPGLFGLVERAEVNIKALQTGLEGEGTTISGIETTISGIETTISGIETEVAGIQTEITGIQGEITGVQGEISSIQFIQLPALTGVVSTIGGIAGDAEIKANRALGIWDYSGDNVYHKKTGNVGIGTTFGSVLTNKLEVNGNINIPTGSTFRIGDEPFNYTHLAGTQPVSSKWTNATDVATNIYYNTGNVGIGITTVINNKLEIGGNLNISAGSKYKINNVDLAFSDLGGTLSYNSLSDKPTLFDGNYNSLTNKLTGGTNIQILNGAINNLYSYTLPTAGVGSGGTLGGVRVDNSTIFINSSGIISSAAGTSYTLPIATSAVIGGVRPDANTIVINNSTGVISSVQTQADWNNTDSASRAFIQNKPTILNSKWSQSGTQIWYNGGNVGIGTATNTAGVLLDVNGTIESRTGIGASSIFYFRGVANSDINRVISANQYSTGSAINDMVIRSTNKLVLQSGIADPAIVINTNNSVGIGTTNPQSILHIHRTATAQDVRIILTDGTTTASSSRGFHLVKTSDSTTYLWNLENTSLIFGTNATERMRILGNGNIYTNTNLNFGVGINPSYRTHLKCTYDSVGTGLHLDADDGSNNPNKYALTIWPFVLGGGSVGWKFRTQSLTGGTNTPLEFTHDGGMRFQKDRWHKDSDNVERFYFQGGTKIYLNSNGNDDILELRQNGGTMRARINANGQLGCHFQTIPSLNTDHLGVNTNTGENSFGYYFIHVLYNTFTGFHRCYYEDDDIFNNDMSKEEIDIFKNNYNGRIVISTGKIKTDLSRTIPNEETEENEMNRPTNYEETKNESPNVEWYSGIDKDGITIEEAIPIVQLCRVKKDKRVYGVLGSADRKTNNKNRLIVNSVGEGAICVCNTNGNIENGDYIQSSELLGFGEKQDDDILHNYSVAKAVMDCTFELDSPYYQCYELENGNGSVRVAFIACTYHCG